jgi:hypothetical protein
MRKAFFVGRAMNQDSLHRSAIDEHARQWRYIHQGLLGRDIT